MPAQRGMALIITLAILVLMLGITMAFFSKVLLDRSIRSASSTRDQTSILARSAVGIITADLLQEIAAGSLPDVQTALDIPYFQPRTINSAATLLGSNIPLVLTPSMSPQRVVNSPSHPTLIKESRNGLPMFAITNGYDSGSGIGSPAQRASPVSTTAGFGQTRGIAAQSWEEIALGDSSSASTPAPPDWIYIDRSANTPVLTDGAVTNQVSRSLENNSHVIGRFAYRIYDVGGLLDLNYLGSESAPGGDPNRGGLRDMPLDPPPALPGLDAGSTNLAAFAAWRAGDGSGTRHFLSRQDLLRTAAARGEIPQTALRWLTVGGHSANSPAFFPNPNLVAASDSSLQASLLNPPLPGVRFPSNVTLSRGSDPELSVPSGSPVMPGKFPLLKLGLLANPNAPAEDLTYYFGLERQGDGSFRYTAADSTGVIKDLAAVASEGREPNFFEVLQAAIATGSLGRNAGNTYTLDNNRDESRTHQTLQIGANIIDQWDADDFPTHITYTRNDPEFPGIPSVKNVYGVENLPYLNSVALIGHRPVWDRDRFQLWAQFDVWNPHQNAGTPPKDIEEFRVRAAPGGRLQVRLLYQVNNVPEVAGGNNPTTTAARVSPLAEVAPLNAAREVKISATVGASEPVLLGSAGPPPAPPESHTWPGGLLLVDFPAVGPAVPPQIQDLPGHPVIPDLNNWLERSGMPRIGQGGTFGAKAHNLLRVHPDPNEKLTIYLEYFDKERNQWITYQSIENFFQPFGNNDRSTSVQSQPQPSSDFLAHTLISENPDNTEMSFYGWRFETPVAQSSPEPSGQAQQGLTLTKFDPRTVRFGHNELRRLQRGRTIRKSTALPGYLSGNSRRDLDDRWLMLDNRPKEFIAGAATATNNSLQPSGAMDWLPISSSFAHYVPFGFIANIPEGSLNQSFNPSRYRDRDGVIRPGDGYLGSVPTAVPVQAGNGKGSLADRPLILNRPFRSVAEMGHAFRDLPWKSLDFFTRNSGDLGLLDAFTLDEEPTRLVEGKVNINSAPEPVLAALLAGTGRTSTGQQPISQAEANQLAGAIIADRNANGPFATVGDLVARVFSPTAHNVDGTFTPSEHRKSEREAAIRTLSAIGETRTWNLLIDLVVQSGKLSPTASGPSQFQARGEGRYWVHLALDRLTGEILQQRWEAINE